MSVLEDVRDHLQAIVNDHEAAKLVTQAKLDAVNAELAKPVPTVAEQLKTLVAQL